MSHYGSDYFDKLYNLVAAERKIILAQYVEKYGRVGRALDVGCGEGEAMTVLDRQGWQVWGVEVSDYARQKSKFKSQITILDISKKNLPYKNDFFDLVLLLDVVEHVHATTLVLAEVQRVLKPGGRLLLTTPNGGSWYWKVFGRWLPHDPTHVNVQSGRYWRQQLQRAGLRVVEYKGIVGFGWPPGFVARQAWVKRGWPVWVGPIYWPTVLGSGTLVIGAEKTV